jgi:hypothetical protein
MPQMSILGIKYGVILVLVAMHDEGIATVIFLCHFSTFSDSLLCACVWGVPCSYPTLILCLFVTGGAG